MFSAKKRASATRAAGSPSATRMPPAPRRPACSRRRRCRTGADKASRRRAPPSGSFSTLPSSHVVARSRLSTASASRAPVAPNAGSFVACTAFTVRAQFVEIGAHHGAAGQRHLAHHQIDRLDAVGAFVDRGDPRVAKMLRGAGLLDEAHAAVHLHAERGDLDADVGRERFGDRREQRGAVVRRLARRRPCRGCRRSRRAVA